MIRALECIALSLLLSTAAAAEVTNRVIARVNERILTLYDFETTFEQALQRTPELPADPADREEFMREMARGLMRTLWEEMLILTRADQRGWSIDDSEVQGTVDRMKKQNGISSDEELASALAQEGLAVDQWREEVRNQLLYRLVIGREVYSQIGLEEEDLRRYYRNNPDEFMEPEQLQVQEIVVLSRANEAAHQELADRVHGQLRGGAALAEVVAGYSSEEISQVIDLGWVAVGDLDSKLAEALDQVDAGEFTSPTAARGGLHIAHLLGRREATLRPFSEIEPELRRREEDKRVEEKLTDYLIKLEQEAYLTLDPPALAAGFRTATGETPRPVDFPLRQAIEEAAD